MLTKPFLLATPSFDATAPKIFSFTVDTPGSQIVSNKLTIRRQSDNEIVYDSKETSYKYEHTLPENTLINGEYYNAVVTVYDARGDESAPSNPIQFWCYTKPVIAFTNFPDSEIINNASFEFTFEYTQTEGERLDSYVVNLYTIGQTLVATSSTIYVKEGTPPFEGAYLFTGFEDDTAYLVEVVGQTINGASVTTGKKRFNVDYEQPDLFTLLELENNCEGGYVTVSSNIVLIDAETQPDPPVYIDNKEIDLTGANAYLKWNQGYSVSDDFLVRAWFRKPKDYSEILRFSTIDGKSIVVKFMRGYEDISKPEMNAYVQVTVTSVEGMSYYIVSNYISPLADTGYYNLQLRREKDIYQVSLLESKKVV